MNDYDQRGLRVKRLLQFTAMENSTFSFLNQIREQRAKSVRGFVHFDSEDVMCTARGRWLWGHISPGCVRLQCILNPLFRVKVGYGWPIAPLVRGAMGYSGFWGGAMGRGGLWVQRGGYGLPPKGAGAMGGKKRQGSEGSWVIQVDHV